MTERAKTRLRAVEPAEREIPFDAELPNHREAEQYILGAVLLNNATLSQAAERLKPADIYIRPHRLCYEAMLAMFEKGESIDPISLGECLRMAGELDTIGGPAFIVSLFDGIPRFSDITNYVRIVKEKSILRQIIACSNRAMTTALDDSTPVAEVLAQIEREILAISEETIRRDFVKVGDAAAQQLEVIQDTAGHEQMVTGLPTGYSDLDYMTSGLQKGDLIIVAGRPSMGKTGLGLCAAANVSKTSVDDKNRVVGVFSLEMATPQLIMRLLCSEARIDAHRLRSGYLGREEWRRLAIAVDQMAEWDLYIDDSPNLTLTEMRAKARKLRNKVGRLDLLLVDYLGLITPLGKPRSEQEGIAQISRGLKMLAKELDIPVIALCQLSRAPETRTGSHKPQLSDLRSSGGIEQDADVVMLIYREEVYKPETEKQNIAEIIIAKQRNGPTGSVELVFLKQLTRFEDKFRPRGSDTPLEDGDGSEDGDWR
jgi:replicative DNA helicase